MKYYHGSPNGNLTKLTTAKSNDGYVWLAEQYAFAVLYGGCPVRFWRVNKTNGKLVIREIAKDGLLKMYKGKACYIYSAENVGEFEQYDHIGRKSIRLNHDVDIKLDEIIPDVYEKIIELYNNSEIEIDFWDNFTEEQKRIEQEKIIRKFAPNMKVEHEKFPEEYEIITNLIPELKLENLKDIKQFETLEDIRQSEEKK